MCRISVCLFSTIEQSIYFNHILNDPFRKCSTFSLQEGAQKDSNDEKGGEKKQKRS
jgi:hypothetical protein